MMGIHIFLLTTIKFGAKTRDEDPDQVGSVYFGPQDPDPLFFGPPDPDLDLDPTCDNGFIKLFSFLTKYNPD